MEWPTLLTIMLFFCWPQRPDDRKATELSRAVTKLRDMVKQLLCTSHPCILSPLYFDRSIIARSLEAFVGGVHLAAGPAKDLPAIAPTLQGALIEVVMGNRSKLSWEVPL